MAKKARYRGWPNSATPRSETARLSSKVFKVVDNDSVFLMAWMFTAFITAVRHSEALNTKVNALAQ